MNVVAYGSLMYRPSLEATLTPVTIPGWPRVFNVAFPDGLSYLSIMPALSGQLEAAYFTVEPSATTPPGRSTVSTVGTVSDAGRHPR